MGDHPPCERIFRHSLEGWGGMTGPWSIVLGLLGCDTEAIDSAVPADCTPSLALSWTGEERPGAELTLSLDGVAVGDAWVGLLDGTPLDSPYVTLPAEPAVHQDHTVTLGAELTRPGCADLVEVTEELTYGWADSDRVLVLYNPDAEGSEDVARAYVEARELPPGRTCPIASTDGHTLDGADYDAWLDEALACVALVGPQVHYLLPVYGVPYKVSGRIEDLSGDGRIVTVSLDAMLALGEASRTATGVVENPIFQLGSSATQDWDPYVPFGELAQELDEPVYLVTRLDGSSAQATLDLIERSLEAQALADAGLLGGTVYVDARYGEQHPADEQVGSYNAGEWNMWGTRYLFEDLGWYPVVWDSDSAEFGTEPALLECPDALYYTGWYSYNNYNDAFTWAPGAIGGHLDSCSACDLRDGPAWSHGALERGITATFGAVNEPYVAGMPEYDQFFLFLTQGASYGEAAYESTWLSLWMMTFVGDPLYRPYPNPLD